MKRTLTLSLLLGALVAAGLAGCDGGVSGDPAGNQPPDTELAVRDTSLVGNVEDDDRFTSTVFVAWSGTDPDGFVVAFDLRYYDAGAAPGPDDGWARTTRRDSLVLLPIPPESEVANVVFEVRAVDDEGAVDPTPARTVFPIRNSPPTLRLSGTLVPADTTWPVVSFGWTASDPDGPESLLGIEIALNDTTDFVLLPPEVDFVTLVAQSPQVAGETTAEIFYGTNFIPSGLSVSGLRIGEDNVLWARAVDQTETASPLARFPAEEDDVWFVRRQTSEVLLVNDYRRAENTRVMPFHRATLADYGGAFDEWDLSRPFSTGNNPVIATSDALPAAASPTLRRTLALWRYIYWVSDQTTDRVQGYNFPVAAGVIDLFFEGGGRIFVQVPVKLPVDPDENQNNPAINILPLGGLITIPDSLVFNNLRIDSGSEVEPVQPVPGTGQALPRLRTTQLVTGTLPYLPGESVPLYEADYYATRAVGGRVDWTGPETVASMSSDRRIALFALPLLSPLSGNPLLEGADGDPAAPRRAIHLILEGLTFPR